MNIIRTLGLLLLMLATEQIPVADNDAVLHLPFYAKYGSLTSFIPPQNPNTPKKETALGFSHAVLDSIFIPGLVFELTK